MSLTVPRRAPLAVRVSLRDYLLIRVNVYGKRHIVPLFWRSAILGRNRTIFCSNNRIQKSG